MISLIIQPEIKELIGMRDFATLKEILIDWEPIDLSELILSLDDDEQAIVFRLLPKELAADTFEYFEPDTQLHLIKSMSNEEVSRILDEMSPDDRTAMLEELPANISKKLLMLLSPSERHIAQALLAYPENSVGRMMTPDYIAVNAQQTVRLTLGQIRRQAKGSETLNIIYVVDNKGKLLDDIKIQDIILAEPEVVIDDIMDDSFVALRAFDDRETAVEIFKKYDRIALPVTDNTGILIGIVTIDDILDVAEEEATEDIQKIAAVQAFDEPYSTLPLQQLIKKRAGWLSILFIGEMLTASAMAFFEDQISKAVILALFVPLIISSGGNSGSQASTLVIRALSLGEISLKDWLMILRREILSGLSLGSILAVIGFLRIFIWQVSSNIYGEHWLLVALTVSFSLIGVVTWGTLMGSMLPLILKSLKFDPAASSAPFVATLVDVCGILIYFGFAIILLKGTLL